MKITRSPALERQLLDQLKQSFFGQPRDGIHLSDLLSPRLTFWRRALPLPPTDVEVLYFIAGRSAEDALPRIDDLDFKSQEEQSYVFIGGVSGAGEIRYRPDFVWEKIPTEFKSRRGMLPKPGTEKTTYAHYLEQISGYGALEDALHTRLVVLTLGHGRAKPPELAVYEIEHTPDELSIRASELRLTAATLQAALVGWSMSLLATGQPDMERTVLEALPLCPAFKCGGRMPKPIKLEPPKTTASGLTSLPGDPREEWVYVPQCPYYRLCQPFTTDPTRQ